MEKDLLSLKHMLENYGNKEVINMLRRVMNSRANELSDLGLKEEARESADLSDILGDLLAE